MKTWLTIAAMIVSIAGYNLWPIIHHDFFYKCMALSLLLLSIVVWLCKDVSKIVSQIFFWLCVNNLMDELFFDPTAFQLNEYIFALIVIIITIRTSYADRQNAK